MTSTHNFNGAEMHWTFSKWLTWPPVRAATLLITIGWGASAVAQAVTPAATAPEAACPTLLKQNVLRLQDEKPQSLCQYSGKVVVVVNTASFCGFTPQYEGLEALHSKYKTKAWWY